MAASKHGLADLKRLHQADEARRKREQAQAKAKAVQAAKAPPLAEDDARLFRQSVRSVQPLRRKPGDALQMAGAALPSEVLAARRKQAMGETPTSLTLSPDMAKAPVPDADDAVFLSTGRPKAKSAPFGGSKPSGAAWGDFLRAGHGPDVLRDLRKGRGPVQASVDLHGNTVEEARRRLEGFLTDCLDYGARCVRVVHGVGYGSPDGVPVLGPQVARWLMSWEAVQAYAACGPGDGGRGALHVLLKPRN